MDSPSRLAPAFYARKSVVVARALLGKRLVSLVGGVRVSGDIVEVEAYTSSDSTSHAFRGPTQRNRSMFRAGGTAYVYFTYGMHYCLNVVTGCEGTASAVLVRALVPREGLDAMRARRGPARTDVQLCRGPACVCVALGINRDLDGIDLCAPDARVFIEDAPSVSRARIVAGPRVGVVGTPADVRAPLRFYLAESPHVSKLPARGRATR